MSESIPEGCRTEICPGCKRMYYANMDTTECNECKNGFRLVRDVNTGERKILVIDQEKFKKAPFYKKLKNQAVKV